MVRKHLFMPNSVRAMTVLIADTNQQLTEELARILPERGVKCLVSNSAEKALSLYEINADVSVVLADINMPPMGGIELMRKLKAWSIERKFAGILMAGEPSYEAAVMAIRLGVVDFLQKPLSPNEIYFAILRAQRSQALDEHIREQNIPSREAVLAQISVARLERDRIFGGQLSDIAWHMLIEIALAETRDEPLTVSSACLASGAPIATAHRHLRFLEERGLIRRRANTADKRSTLLEMTTRGDAAIERFVERYRRHWNTPCRHQTDGRTSRAEKIHPGLVGLDLSKDLLSVRLLAMS